MGEIRLSYNCSGVDICLWLRAMVLLLDEVGAYRAMRASHDVAAAICQGIGLRREPLSDDTLPIDF